MENGILHVDMNNFYASVEILAHPEYRDVPMAVAGDPGSRHGIILAKNIPAKKLGVKTAEPIWRAKQKAMDLILVKPHFEKYTEFSRMAKEIYLGYTDRVESFGLDECWLDVYGSERLFGSGTEIAHSLRRQIKSQLGLTVSVGVSFNKTFAKLGSDFKKPDAVTVFSKENYRETVWKLPITELLFVGRKTGEALGRLGIHTIGELACADVNLIKSLLGKNGVFLHGSACGEDGLSVSRYNEREECKTIGNSVTLPKDIFSQEEARKVFLGLAETVGRRLRKHGLKCGEVQIWIRSPDFKDIQRQCQLEHSAYDTQMLYETAVALYERENCKKGIRGLGLRAGRLTDAVTGQISLFGEDEGTKRREKLDCTVDILKGRFGDEVLGRAALFGKEGEEESEEYPGFIY